MPKITHLVSPEEADALTSCFSLIDEALDDEEEERDGEETPAPTKPTDGISNPSPTPTKPEGGALASALVATLRFSHPAPPKAGNVQTAQSATGVHRSQAENSAMTNGRYEVARYLRAFGPQGAAYFIDGLSFAEAREEYLKATHDERQRIWASGTTRNIARFSMGCKPPGQR